MLIHSPKRKFWFVFPTLNVSLFKVVFILLLFSLNLFGQGYYDGTEGLSGEALKHKLHTIIRGHTRLSYSGVWNALETTDEDPNNSNNVILIYTGRSQDKDLKDQGSGDDTWNREHVWPNSHGFPDQGDTAYTDIHHLRPCDRSVNADRGNLDFDNGGSPQGEAPDTYYDFDSWEPRDEIKGDIARMVFYMDVRYGPHSFVDLEIVDNTGTSPGSPELGKFSTLLSWHLADPVDGWEQSRNDKIYNIQGNRNPFIDHPEFVELIYGDQGGTKNEPSNHLTDFNASPEGAGAVDLTWSDASGSVLPDGYLIKASTTDSFTSPTDGTDPAVDSDLSDGTALVKVSFGVELYSFSNLNLSTQYFFKAWSFTNSGNDIDFKTDGIVPTTDATTGTAEPNPDSFYISEYSDASGSGNYIFEFIEFYNNSENSIDISNFVVRQENSTQQFTIPVSTVIAPHGFFVLGRNADKSSFENFWNTTFNANVTYLNSNEVIPFINGGEVFLIENTSGVNVDPQVDNEYTAVPVEDAQRVIRLNTGNSVGDYLVDSNTNASPGRFDNNQELPFELTSFTAELVEDKVILNWETATEVNNVDYDVERKSTLIFEKIGFVEGNDTTTSSRSYSFVDENLPLVRKVSYRLKQIGDNGDFQYSDTIDVNLSDVTGVDNKTKEYEFSLGQNYPNPFNPTTTIKFSLPDLGSSRIAVLYVFNMLGQKVAELINEPKSGGSYEISFNAEALVSGIYFYKLNYGTMTKSKKLILLK